MSFAGPAEVAIDPFLADDPLDGVHASVEAAVEQVRPFGAEPSTHGGVVLGEAVVHMAAVAARGGASDTLGFQQHDLRALLCQRQSGGKAGEPAAHDDDVRAATRRSLHRPVEARSCVVPVRGELHCQPPKRGHSASTLVGAAVDDVIAAMLGARGASVVRQNPHAVADGEVRKHAARA